MKVTRREKSLVRRNGRRMAWGPVHARCQRDAQGRRYQAGVFWAGEACALGFRRDAGLITNLSEFMPHILV